MKLPIFGLRAGILTQLIFLIVAAMLLVSIALLNLYEKDLIKAREQAGKILLLAIEQNLGHTLENATTGLNNLHTNNRFINSVQNLLKSSDYSDLIIINNDGGVIFNTGSSGNNKQYGRTLAMSAISTAAQSVNLKGSTWGVLWPRKSEICISSPLTINGRMAGGISVISSLVPVYEVLRISQKFVIYYILIDTVILALVGMYLLSRIVVSPIHRILKMTEEYEDGEFMPTVGEAPKNEIGNLSRSLANMLNRLDENKKELKSHIISLEKVNNDLKAAQNEIIRSEKLASVGRLAAGIAHEIGNPIGIILGYLDLIRKEGLSREEEKDFIFRIESEITRVNIIIRQLLDFSRNSIGQTEGCSIHDLIIGTVEMLMPQSRMKALEIELDLRAESDIVLADKNQLQQVFLNILINSIDALEEENQPENNSLIRVESINKKCFLELKFIDNGSGISTDDLNHIFDPFFTTKEPGQGTGLGLSVCYRIIEGLEGTIKAQSSPGKGMEILIALPLYKDVDDESQGDTK